MKFILLERYITAITPEDKEKYKDIVWGILQRSYKDIGGFWTYQDADELVASTSLWKLYRKEGGIRAVAVYRDKYGRKCIGLGSDGTLSGVEGLMRIMKEDQDPKLKRAWIEIAPNLDKLWKKIGGRQIPSKLMDLILKTTGITPTDEHHYERMIANNMAQIKSAWGWPKTEPELSLESVKFKILTNPSYDWKKRRKPKMPKQERSIPDSDLCMQKGKSYRQALTAHREYRYEGKPYGADKPHV